MIWCVQAPSGSVVIAGLSSLTLVRPLIAVVSKCRMSIARVLAGEDVSYNALPWFWSDQYDCKLQIVGLNLGHDRTVVRPGASESSRSVWYYRGDRLLAIDAMNEPKSYAFGRKIIESGKNPAPETVIDLSSGPTTGSLKRLAFPGARAIGIAEWMPYLRAS